MGRVLQESHRGLSPLIFALPPNPSIDHLVGVILKYPQREESGQGKRLNPGATNQRYTGPRIWTSENATSTADCDDLDPLARVSPWLRAYTRLWSTTARRLQVLLMVRNSAFEVYRTTLPG